jgi:hypothetical protein
MSISKRIIAVIALSLAAASLFAQADKKAGPYMGQTAPDLTPQVFAPGLVSVPNRYTYDICFSRDGLECFFTVRNAAWDDYKIMTMRFEKGGWTAPVRASFSNNHSMSPSLADNDQTIYFSRDQWGAAEYVPAPASSSQPEYSLNVSDSGNAWICSHRVSGVGKCDVWRIAVTDGKFGEPVDLRVLNTMANDCVPLPGPKEAWVVFSSDRPGGAGGMDIYVSWGDGQGGWTSSKNLGANFNTTGNDNAGSLSPDGKYLFFSRETSTGSDIYWVSVKAFLNDPQAKAAPK